MSVQQIEAVAQAFADAFNHGESPAVDVPAVAELLDEDLEVFDTARSTVIALAKEIGFEGVDAGHLDASPNIENLGLLVGQLAYGSGFGNRVTLRAYVAPRPVRRARPGKGSTVPKRRRNP